MCRPETKLARPAFEDGSGTLALPQSLGACCPPCRMPPPPLYLLLGAESSEAREAAWAEFLERHSKLILHTAQARLGRT